jgi:hypothetical protein
MSLRQRAVLAAAVLACLLGSAACNQARGLFGKQYEYEEDLYVSLDGSATLVVNSSLPALVALRGLAIDPNPSGRIDADKIRAAYQSPVTEVTRVSPPWRRKGRRFVQVRVTISDIRKLHESAPLAWSRYGLAAQNGVTVFTQHVGAAAFRPGTLQSYGWDGSEVVAFRLHLPSKVRWHNSRSLETNQPLSVARGNILGWEQHLTDRLDGVPLDIRVEMESQSILYRTLWLFGSAFLAAVLLLVALIWWTIRKGRRQHQATTPAAP